MHRREQLGYTWRPLIELLFFGGPENNISSDDSEHIRYLWKGNKNTNWKKKLTGVVDCTICE